MQLPYGPKGDHEDGSSVETGADDDDSVCAGERDEEEHSAESGDEGGAYHHFSSAVRVCAEVAGEVHALPKAAECS